MGKREHKTGLACMFTCVLFLSGLLAHASGNEAPVRNAAGVYEIADGRQLVYLSRHFGSAECPADGHYALTADIDLSGTENFTPIRGNFLGRFDGRFHAIRNLTILQPDMATVGLFGNVGNAVTQAVVENLALVDVYVLGRNTVGAIAGALYGTVRNCYVSGEVHALMHCAGGIVGRLPEIAGQRVTPLMRDCFSSAAVICEGEADSQGGLSGRLLSDNGVIERCISSGEVVGRNKTGGLVGQVSRTGHVRCCMAVNRSLEAAPDSRSVGGAVGQAEPGAEICRTAVWEASGPRGKTVSDGATAVSSASFAERGFYENFGWHFGGLWSWRETAFGKGYPVLAGFARFPFGYDFSWGEPQIPVHVRTRSDTSCVTLRLESGSEESGIAYCVMRADRGLPALAVWSAEPEARFDGLEPATAYPFCYKVKDRTGRESRWYRITVNTRYRVSTDKTPRNVAAVTTSDPSVSLSFGWTTYDTTLTASTVWIVPERDSVRLPDCLQRRGTGRTEAVRGTVNKRLYDGARTFHRATVGGLVPGTRYLYRVGDAESGIVSPVHSVTTAPASREEGFGFVYVADLQVDNPLSVQAVRRTYGNILERMPEPAFLYLAGDMTENGYNYTQWDRFFEAGDTLLRNCFVVPVQGNHDSDGDLANHFPAVSSVEGMPFVYSFDYGCVHFIVLNTQYWEGTCLDRQIAWMERDLAEKRRRWNIVLLHKALYAATDHVDDEDIDFLRGKLAPRFEEWGIDAVLMGHDHSFTRSFVRNGRNARVPFLGENGRQVFRSPSAPLYVVNGTGGISKWYHKILYDASALTRVSSGYEFADKTSAGYDRSLREQSFTLVDVTPRALTLETWSFRCDGNDPERYVVAPYLFDSIQIVK
ncbi:fibronectin type III domain-containing protein [Gallalistipes aquisgranensis]|uniref:fibronectin type III domain-containing protein n=1 Tax=Gallalistipes aquisgranensis TaxID=2779358 RepID=UPI001CF81C23|nr:fibronectin type III domain-containing protein [Gallalistipes aquisgranensis]MBE5033265.1 metallophosphoesterase family protein [Gallalistipes aquisgranensis]